MPCTLIALVLAPASNGHGRFAQPSRYPVLDRVVSGEIQVLLPALPRRPAVEPHLVEVPPLNRAATAAPHALPGPPAAEPPIPRVDLGERLAGEPADPAADA